MTKFMNVEASRFGFESVNGVVFMALESGLTKMRIKSVSSRLSLDSEGKTLAETFYVFHVFGSNEIKSFTDTTIAPMYASVEDFQNSRALIAKTMGSSALVKGKTWATVSRERDEEENEYVIFSAWVNKGNGPVAFECNTIALERTYDEEGKAAEAWYADGVKITPAADIFATREDCLSMTPFIYVDENGSHRTPARLEYLMITNEQKPLIEALKTAIANMHAAGLECVWNGGGLNVINVANLVTERPEVAEGEPQPVAESWQDINRVAAHCVVEFSGCNHYYRKPEAPAANANA